MAITEQRKKRLPPEIFDLPVEKMREGYYTDAYFNHTRSALLADERHPRVVMQVFQKHNSVLGGMDEAIAILKLCVDDWEALTVHALYDGDRIEPWETVMTVEGDYTLFAHLETVYLGVLARRTLVSTNTRRVIEAANRKPIPARSPASGIPTSCIGLSGPNVENARSPSIPPQRAAAIIAAAQRPAATRSLVILTGVRRGCA